MPLSKTFVAKAGRETHLECELSTIENMPGSGWHSGDMHVHFTRHNKRDDSILAHLMEAEGLSAVTGQDSDRFKFKVPTLRNVELTYPYFHDGEAETLTEAVDIMGKLQLGKQFTPSENAQIVAFLKTLTGDQPSFILPILPPSVDKTPKPTPFE